MSKHAETDEPTTEPTPEPTTEPTPEPEPEPESKPTGTGLADDLADKSRGDYESEMIGDSTLVIRYADGTQDSFTVEDVTR